MIVEGKTIKRGTTHVIRPQTLTANGSIESRKIVTLLLNNTIEMI